MTSNPAPSAERGDPATAALAVQDLQLAYVVRGVPREVLRGVTFQVRPGN
jgi:peptide/nickel transport system ATP-binding protein